MRKRIKDEFTHLPVSRQRKYQLRMKRDRRCTECGEPAVQGSRCLKHLVKARERQRKKRGLKRRYHGTLSYRLEAAARKRRRGAPVARSPWLHSPRAEVRPARAARDCSARRASVRSATDGAAGRPFRRSADGMRNARPD